MKKQRVLLIQSRITPYRVPVFNELSEKYELQVIYDKGEVPDGIKFETKKIDLWSVRFLRKIHKDNILHYTKKFDVVIMMMDPSYLTTHVLVSGLCKVPVILWGIGVAAARDMRYDGCQKTAGVLGKLISKSDASLFYSDYPVSKYSDMGIPKEKMFVANNTVRVCSVEKKEKTDLLFLGSLYKAKKIFELLQCYKNAFIKNSDIPNLKIIGDGEEYQSIKCWIENHKLNEKIHLEGAVFDDDKLAKYFEKAILCISPDQAGLSVLKSMGYGVPFVTHKDAITGGERLNIINGKNGILLDDFRDIETIILDSSLNKDKYEEIGQNAYEYYWNNRTVSDMVNGFCDAIDYVLSKG